MLLTHLTVNMDIILVIYLLIIRNLIQVCFSFCSGYITSLSAASVRHIVVLSHIYRLFFQVYYPFSSYSLIVMNLFRFDRASEILFSLTLAEMRRFHGDDRLMADFPAHKHFQRLTEGRRNLALFQHHDAVTGTARDPVVVDYGTRWLLPVSTLAC